MGKNGNKKNVIEKITFGFGLVVFISLISYLIFELIQKNNKPPQLVISTSYEPKIKPYSYKVLIENIGDETAASVQLKLELFQDGKSVESNTLSLKYVPVKSKKTAWVTFHKRKKPDDSLVISSFTFIKP